MGEIIHLPGSSEARARQLETLITASIAAHPDAEVAERWAAMAKVTARRFPGPPDPSKPELDLGSLSSLDPKEKAHLMYLIERWMLAYFEDVNGQLLAMHGVLLRAQKELAELQVERSDSQR